MRHSTALTLLIAVLPWIAPARADECPAGRGIYQGFTNTLQELRFTDDRKGTLRLASPWSVVRYEFEVVRPEEGLPRNVVQIVGERQLSSDMLGLTPEFEWAKRGMSAPYLLIPELQQRFFEWKAFRKRSDYLELLPELRWKLTGCRP